MMHTSSKIYPLIKKIVKSYFVKYPLIKNLYFKVKDKLEFYKLDRLSKQQLKIFIYFSEGFNSLDKIMEWLEVFNNLNKDFPLIIIVRNKDIEKLLRKRTKLEVYCTVSLNKLLIFYEYLSPKVILYIGNGYRNFQSLIYNDAIHIYLSNSNSNQGNFNRVKAYDFVYISGEYELNKYMTNLLRVNSEIFKQVGRPILDFINPIKLNTLNKKVLLYSPDLSLYNDLDVIDSIIDNIINSNDFYLIYKPKNYKLLKRDEDLKEFHNNIIDKIKDSKYATYLSKDNIKNIYPIVNLTIFDIFDYDYLFFDKPFLVTEKYKNCMNNVQKSKLDKIIKYIETENNFISSNNLDKLLNLIENRINDYPKNNKNKEIKKYYMNNYEKGKSFLALKNELEKAIEFRDIEIQNKGE